LSGLAIDGLVAVLSVGSLVWLLASFEYFVLLHSWFPMLNISYENTLATLLATLLPLFSPVTYTYIMVTVALYAAAFFGLYVLWLLLTVTGGATGYQGAAAHHLIARAAQRYAQIINCCLSWYGG
jgi:hypothetical protein